MNQYSMGSPRAEHLLQAARDMQPVLRERAAECKSLRRVPDETVADFKAAGFFKILQSEQFGGYAMDPQVFYAVGLEVAKACMSSAWVLGVVAVHNWQLALFDDQAAQDVWAEDPEVLISSSYAPVGKVVPVDGGFKLSGRWSFSSGSEHCKWVFLGAVVPTEDAPFDMSNYRTFLVPIADYEIADNWDVVGLQGTGSHDVIVEDAFVPEHRTHKVIDGFNCDNPGNEINSAPLYRMPFMQVFVRAVCTASLGALHGSLDNFVEVAKTRQAGPVPMRDDPMAKLLAAEVKAEIEQMKLVMYRNFDAMMDCTRAGEPIAVEDRIRYRYDSAMVADRCLAMSSKMLKAAGSSGIRQGSELLSRHLDILASQAHVANNSTPFAMNMGGVLFGQPNADFGL
ncbi:flavin-dependent monooxygenase [Halieaceae bacterium IMCC14734]|uniref:Flavin-dependent monooxygenase n=1 Tax=Candidatus Litorirhabdus singularis TaxID=2518993 RepID=A0ABT3TI63_9GAMM|nr:flavin-dependent monooxygenase [Candidatus Litorirhabdus singularis]MCX2981900.1 flavin-dependent monooxygenase [Candidatus Litorirhabdus singularis]